MNPKPICPTCGNTMFHCGLAGEPYWCGACNTRTHAPDLACPKCGRALDKSIGVDAFIDPDLACPQPPKAAPQPAAAAPQVKVRFDKQYTNHTGRSFARFVAADGRRAELVMRPDRASLALWTRAEAKAHAVQHFTGRCGGQESCPVTVH